MRHAKSSWKEAGLSDHDRPLNGRGRRDAPRVGARLTALGWIPDLAVSSDAERTRLTWEGMALASPVRFTPTFYLAGLREIRRDATDWDADLRTVLVLGHNPGWSEALMALSDEPSGMTTGNAGLLLGAGGTWLEALQNQWELIELIRPRELER